ncbi:MAG: cytochrome-c oxidase, cbb3-type subunit III [Cardiobacteriaceae bacterium]|nr:cytochrome-c oxidase, cbb3-type subunit III [Cardiobacteriaceae bacterium]
MTTVSIFIAVVTILHLLGYIALVYWTTHIKAGGNAKEGEIIDHTWDGDLKEMNNPLPGWWLSLFYLMIAVGIIYLILYPGVFKGIKGWTQIGQYEQESRRADALSAEYFQAYSDKSVEELAKDPDALATGHRIFSQNCAVCHASDAGGQQGSYPNLTDNEWIWGGTPEAIINTITNGHIGAMPAGGALITVDPTTPNYEPSKEDKEKLENVSQYVLSLGGYKHDASAAAKGQELYANSCIACHGPDGKGNQLIGAINLADNIWLYSPDTEDPEILNNFIQHQIVHPHNNVMPTWKDILGDDRIKVVAAYVYSLSHDSDSEENSAATPAPTTEQPAVSTSTSESATPAATTESPAQTGSTAAPVPAENSATTPAPAAEQPAVSTSTSESAAPAATTQPPVQTGSTATVEKITQ